MQLWATFLVVLFWLVIGSAQAENILDKTREKLENPGPSAVKVDIEGLEGDFLANAEAYLQIYQKRNEEGLTDNWVRHYHDSAIEELQEALQPFGHYQVEVNASLTKQDNGHWLAHYVVDPGPQTMVTTVDLQWLGEGAKEPKLLAAAAAFVPQSGQPLIHSIYEEAKSVLLAEAGLLGYHDVIATVNRVLVDPRRNTASIRLHIDTGEKYFLGEIHIQQDILEDEFVYRYLADFHEGDPYSQDLLLSIQRSLVESGYFSIVDVKPQFEEAVEYQVPVKVKLSPSKRQTYAFGLGYNTDVGINGSVRWQHRRLNTSGHRADAFLRLSAVELLLRGGYWIPIRDPRVSKIGLTTKLEAKENDSSDWVSLELEAGYYHEIKDWHLKLFTNILFEEYTAGTEPTEQTALWSVGGQAERLAFEEGSYPRRGWSLFSNLRGAPGGISSTDYLRLHLKGKVYLPLADRGRFVLRAEVGAAGVGDFDKYPTSLRFFAGGDQSVRGYEYESLGPENDEGDVVGGKHTFTSTLEYDHLFTETLGAAIFVDAGNAYNDELDKLFFGSGIGARYLSPVGLVRLDVAWPLNKSDDDPQLSDYRIHFGFEVNL